MTTPNQMQEWLEKMRAERAERRKTQTDAENRAEDFLDEAMTAYGQAEQQKMVLHYNHFRHASLTLCLDALTLANSAFRKTLDEIHDEYWSRKLPTTRTCPEMGNGLRLVEEAVQCLWAVASRFEDEGDGCGCEPKRPAHVDPNPTACHHIGPVTEELPVPREPDNQDNQDDHRR